LTAVTAFEYLVTPRQTEDGGTTRLCACSSLERAPTHRQLNSSDLGATFWCKRCGYLLPLVIIDKYRWSDDYEIEQEFQDYRQEQRDLKEKEQRKARWRNI